MRKRSWDWPLKWLQVMPAFRETSVKSSEEDFLAGSAHWPQGPQEGAKRRAVAIKARNRGMGRGETTERPVALNTFLKLQSTPR